MDAFISYRRKPSAALALLIQEKLINKYAIDAYVDTTRADSTKVQFPERLMQAIGKAPVFICLLGEETLESEWVLKEIEEAYRLQKRCIPIFQESYKAPAHASSAVNYLLNFDGIHVMDLKNIHVDYSVQELALLIKPKEKNNLLPIGLVVGFLLLLGILAVIFLPNMLGTQGAELTQAALAQSPEVTNSPEAPTNTDRPSPTEAPSNTPNPTDTATEAPTNTVTERPSDTPNPTEAPSNTATRQASLTNTATERPSDTPSPTVNSNGQSHVPTVEFNPITGHSRVIVPAGNFEDANGSSSSQFWIDEYEVSNQLFIEFVKLRGSRSTSRELYYDVDSASGGIYIGGGTYQLREGMEDWPVVEVTWLGANAYCHWIGGRLPSASEWNKAAVWNPATGTSTIYPWGDNPDPNRTNLESSSLVPVSSYENGRSLSGAYQLLGNAAEWVSNSRGANRYYLGGSFAETWRSLSMTSLSQSTENFHSARLGFRCAYDN